MLGSFAGGYVLAPVRPLLWEYRPVPWDPLRFTRPGGSVITLPDPFETDLGTIPRALWSIPGFAPADLEAPAIVHDWLYQAHHDGRDVLGFAESNRVLYEACRAWGYSRCQAWVIREACDLFGRRYWDRGG